MRSRRRAYSTGRRTAYQISDRHTRSDHHSLGSAKDDISRPSGCVRQRAVQSLCNRQRKIQSPCECGGRGHSDHLCGYDSGLCSDGDRLRTTFLSRLVRRFGQKASHVAGKVCSQLTLKRDSLLGWSTLFVWICFPRSRWRTGGAAGLRISRGSYAAI